MELIYIKAFFSYIFRCVFRRFNLEVFPVFIQQKIFAVSFTVFTASILAQNYLILPVESAIFGFTPETSLLFIPHGVMVVLGVLFGWASVLGVFAAHFVIILLPESPFIFGNNGVWAAANSLSVPVSIFLLIHLGLKKSAFKNNFLDFKFMVGVGLISAFLMHALFYLFLKITNLGIVSNSFFASFIGQVTGLFALSLLATVIASKDGSK